MKRAKSDDVKLSLGTTRTTTLLANFIQKRQQEFGRTKKVLTPVLRLLHPYRILLLGECEFHSVQLARWRKNWKIDFALRQKKGTWIVNDESVYQTLKDLGIRLGSAEFIRDIYCTKTHQLGKFNLAAYWKRKYRGTGPKEPWYILTTLKSLKLTLSFYAARWGIVGAACRQA